MRSAQQIVRAEVQQVVRQIAAKFAEEALRGIMDIANDTRNPPGDRLKGYNSILDRAAGKPTQEIVDETHDHEGLLARMREASEAARGVMGRIAPPHEQPMAEVIELHPNKAGVFQPRRKRRLKDTQD